MIAFAPDDVVALLAFVAFVAAGLNAVPSAQIRATYATTRPRKSPPAWIFAVVWPVLYAMIAAAGFLAWFPKTASPVYYAGLAAYGANVLLNKAWTPLFFGLRMPLPAFAVLLAMQATAVAFVALQCVVGGVYAYVAAGLFAPYIGWCCYAAYLNVMYIEL